MFKIKIAGINVLVHNKYAYSEFLCKDYFTFEKQTDFEVFATEADIESEMKNSEISVTPEYAESVCIHRAIAERLAEFDALLLHSALIECDGVGVAFAARSGVGKSTHVSIWKKVFENRVRVINGDKPILRLVDGRFLAYGTPWLGKEGDGENSFCEFKALCFLERGLENKISSISPDIAAMLMFTQIYLPQNGENAAKTLELSDKLASQISFYKLACNMNVDAAIVSYNAIIKKEV